MALKHQFIEWMSRIAKSNRPSTDIIAFNFGLFETGNGFTVYLIGSRSFDKEDDDWATEIDFEPKEKYFEIDPNETRGLDWNEVREKVKTLLSEFVSSDLFRDSILKQSKHITIGFDDGELEVIR